MSNLSKIIKIISGAYPDDMIELYHEEPDRLHGDSLAEFIEREVRETFEEGNSWKDQLEEAHRVMVTARDELDAIVAALEKEQAKLHTVKKATSKGSIHQFGPIGVWVSEDETKVTITDSKNPRLHAVYWKCHGEGCPEWIEEDEVIWATPDGKLNTDTGDPYCDSCLPEEKT